MNKFQELKQMLGNKEVVQKYLGLPEKSNSNGNWYKSPFRSERTASFYVSDKGIHDFGSGEHFDIISFVQKFYNISVNSALEVLCKDFNINDLGNEYTNKDVIKMLKQKKLEEKQAKEMVENWFITEMQDLCNKIQINEKCLNVCKQLPNTDVLKVLYDEQTELEYCFEVMLKLTEEEKINLYLEAQNDKRRENTNIRKNECTRVIL